VAWGNPHDGGDCSALHGKLGAEQLQATRSAFAAILSDGSVVAWGNPSEGGDASLVQDQLRHVQQLQVTECGAFAAILTDGSLVAWGHPDYGGDTSAVNDQLGKM
jgi:hypothetical protein